MCKHAVFSRYNRDYTIVLRIQVPKGRIAVDKYAVTLAGGGSKGIYQIGAWKALKELGIEYGMLPAPQSVQ